MRRLAVAVILLAVDEQHHIGLRLDGAAVAQVRKHRSLVLAPFDGARQLRQHQHGHMELAGDLLERAGNLANLLVAVLHALVGRAHQLQVIDHDKSQFAPVEPRLEAAALRPHLDRREAAGVVDVNLRLEQSFGGAREQVPLVLVQLQAAQSLRVNSRLRAEHALHQLLGRHLQTKDWRLPSARE
jgi:hypothetical protein